MDDQRWRMSALHPVLDEWFGHPEVIATTNGLAEEMERRRLRYCRKSAFFSIPTNLWDTVVTVLYPWGSRAKAFS